MPYVWVAREGRLDGAGWLPCELHVGQTFVFTCVHQECPGRSVVLPRVSIQVQCVPSLLSLEGIGVSLVNSATLEADPSSNPVSTTFL